MYYKIYIEEVYEIEAKSLDDVHDIIMNQDLDDRWKTKAHFVGDSITIQEDIRETECGN